MSKQYPSKALKVDQETKTEYLNSEVYTHYYFRFMLMCISMFKWENLPNNIPERFVERVLFNEGQIAFLRDENVGFIMTHCTQYDQLNIYDEPIAWNCFSNNGYWTSRSSDEIEIIRNNKLSLSTSYLLQHHIQRLCNIERTIDTNLWQQRNLALFKSTEEGRLTIKNVIKDMDEGKYATLVTDKFNADVDTLTFNIPFISDKLEELKNIKWNDCLNMLGINTANTDKKERLITDEVNANNQMVQLNLDVMLTERQLAVDSINKKFGTNIKVSLRQENTMKGGENNEQIHYGTEGNSRE